jgi:acetyl esterase/lipase
MDASNHKGGALAKISLPRSNRPVLRPRLFKRPSMTGLARSWVSARPARSIPNSSKNSEHNAVLLQLKALHLRLDTAHAQIHHGQADHVPGTGFKNAQAIADTLEREHTSTELFAYPGAGHGFVGADQANTSARNLSKARALSFFQSHLC